MTAIADIQNPWRNLLQTPASWRTVIFHVETGSRLSGRRTAVHEYPKRNVPYAEDMGRHARRISFTGYLIYRINPAPGMSPYIVQRKRLIDALEEDGPGRLVHPVFWPDGANCVCERYTMTESRQRGGYTEFEMMFVEVGSPGNFTATRNTASAIQSNVTANNIAATAALDGQGYEPGTRPGSS